MLAVAIRKAPAKPETNESHSMQILATPNEFVEHVASRLLFGVMDSQHPAWVFPGFRKNIPFLVIVQSCRGQG